MVSCDVIMEWNNINFAFIEVLNYLNILQVLFLIFMNRETRILFKNWGKEYYVMELNLLR